MGKKEEPFNLEETKKQVKAKQKEENMKNIKENQTVKTIITVIISVAITLGLVYAGYSLYKKAHADGMQYQKSLSAQVEREVTAKVESLKQ